MILGADVGSVGPQPRLAVHAGVRQDRGVLARRGANAAPWPGPSEAKTSLRGTLGAARGQPVMERLRGG